MSDMRMAKYETFIEDINSNIKKNAGIFGLFGRKDDFVIPWNRICRIGPDIILVEAKPEDLITLTRASAAELTT